MRELKSSRWIIVKGVLFLLLGLVAGALVIVEHPTIRDGALLVLAIWCFCRSYYFAFYVVEHYVDSNYRFSGLFSFACYVIRRRS